MFWYVCTPYRAYPGGLDAAAEAAAEFAAELVDRGLDVFSPVVHFHRIAKLSKTPPGSNFWLQRMIPFLEAAGGIIVGTHLSGWERSEGVEFEVNFMRTPPGARVVFDGDLKPLDWRL